MSALINFFCVPTRHNRTFYVSLRRLKGHTLSLWPSKDTGRSSTQPRPLQHKNLHISVTGPTTDIPNAGIDSTFSDCAQFGAGPGSARDNPDVTDRVKSWEGPTGPIFGLGGPRGGGTRPIFCERSKNFANYPISGWIISAPGGWVGRGWRHPTARDVFCVIRPTSRSWAPGGPRYRSPKSVQEAILDQLL